MNPTKTHTVTQQINALLAKITRISDVSDDPMVQEAKAAALRLRKPKLDELHQQVDELRAKLKPKVRKPRIPEDCPPEVVAVCQQYWNGTTESSNFMIKAWDDNAVVTVGSACGYSDNRGWNPVSPEYIVISRKETERFLGHIRPKTLFRVETHKHHRATPARYQEWLQQAKDKSQS